MSARVVAEDEMDALFTEASISIVRVETLPSYSAADDESAALELYRQEVTATVARGVSWERLRVVDSPPTDYQRWELDAYAGNQAAGETIWIVRIPMLSPPCDYWLFDDQIAVIMRYSSIGAVESLERVDDATDVAGLARYAQYLKDLAVSLDEYLAASGVATRAS